jgi:hypothetical protein
MLAIEGRAALPEEKFNEVSSVYCQEICIAHTYTGCGKIDTLC